MNLLRAVENCLRSRDIPPSRFGRDVANDPRLVFDLRRGRQLRPATEARVRNYIAQLQGGQA